LDVELRHLESEQVLQVARADAASFELKRVLGLTAAETVAIRNTLEDLVQRDRSSVPIGQDTTNVAEQRTDVREAAARVDVAEAKIDRAVDAGRFDVSLFGSYMRMDAGFSGLLSTGAPETRTDGLWNNVSQCCGDAGIGDFALLRYRASADDRYLDLAVRVAAELERRSESVGDERWWPQAEHRERPKFLQAQTGYMQGAAGIGSFFLNLHGTLSGRSPKIRLPDVPG
jgi:outer membrane protein TolC